MITTLVTTYTHVKEGTPYYGFIYHHHNDITNITRSKKKAKENEKDIGDKTMCVHEQINDIKIPIPFQLLRSKEVIHHIRM